MKGVVNYKVIVFVLFVLCQIACTDEPNNPNNPNSNGNVEVEYKKPSEMFITWDKENAVVSTPEIYKYRDLARAITALNLDYEIYQEVYEAVRKSVENGLDESYFLVEALEGKSKVSMVERVLSDKLNHFPNNSAVKYIKDFWNKQADKERLQIYWPYSENWDGKSAPIIACCYQGYIIAENGQIIDGLDFTEEYAKINPVWIINESPVRYSALPNFAECNYVEDVNNTIVYHSVYKNGLSEDVPKYLTLDDKDSYFRERTTTTYSMYIKDVSAAINNELYEGGQYYFVTTLDIGENIRSLSDLDAYTPRYITNRFCLLRSQLMEYKNLGKLQNINILITGNSQPNLISIPGAIGQICGQNQSWTDKSKLLIFDLDDNSKVVSRDFLFPKNECSNVFCKSQTHGFTRLGSSENDYTKDYVFTNVIFNCVSMRYTIGYVVGETLPEWQK